jgi:hypothetical protein
LAVVACLLRLVIIVIIVVIPFGVEILDTDALVAERDALLLLRCRREQAFGVSGCAERQNCH